MQSLSAIATGHRLVLHSRFPVKYVSEINEPKPPFTFLKSLGPGLWLTGAAQNGEQGFLVALEFQQVSFNRLPDSFFRPVARNWPIVFNYVAPMRDLLAFSAAHDCALASCSPSFSTFAGTGVR